MTFKVTPEQAIGFMQKSVAVAFTWPLSSTASKRQVLVHKILQVFTAFISFTFSLALLYSTYVNRHDTFIIAKCIIIVVAVAQPGVNATIALFRYTDFQYIIEEMMVCVKEASTREREVFQKYVDRCRIVYPCAIVWYYMCLGSWMLSPILLPQPLPTDAEYPFSTDSLFRLSIVYIHQYISGAQIAGAMSHSGFAALLLWFTAARFECLMLELQETSDARMLIKCIKKQIQLRRYARQVVSCFRLNVAAAVVLSTLGLAFSCVVLMLILLTLIEKVQNVTVFFTILLQIFVYAWPADKLKEMSMAVSQGAYESEWYAQAVSVQKDIGYMLAHQHPVTLSVSGLMPELTLRYYSAYLSNAFSIITTLHVALEMD